MLVKGGPGDTKKLSEPLLTYQFCGINMGAIRQEVEFILIGKMGVKCTL